MGEPVSSSEMPRSLTTFAALLLTLWPAWLDAQLWHLDASGTRIAFDTVATLNSASLAPLLVWQTRRTSGSLGGSIARFGDAQWASQGRTDLSLLLSPFGPLSATRFELAGGAAGTYHSSGFRTAATRGEFRFHLGGRHLGAWVGPAGATGWTSADAAMATGVGATGGLWTRYATTRAALGFAPLRIAGFWLPEVSAQASTIAGPLELAAYAGWRGAEAGSQIDPATWGGGSVTLWLGRMVALVLAGGSYPQDVLQGLPGGRYGSAGVRVTSRRPPVMSVKPLAPPAYRRDDGSGVLRFRVPQAQRLDLVAEWTNWEPVPLERAADGWWMLRVRLAPGVHRFNLVVDGAAWIVPEGVASVDDGYGGRTGLLIVP
jgi:hypothetical protein